MSPAWSRWLPCTVHLLRIVPHPHRFPRRAWDDLADPFDWDEPAWCDPGDPDEVVARATAGCLPGEREATARYAREHYDERVRLRAERIEAFTAMCRRAAIVPPATLSGLLDCLVAFGLYREDRAEGQSWLAPRLWKNPIDVLPFSFEEIAEEVAHQHHERALLAGAGLRRLVLAGQEPSPRAGTVTVTVTPRAVAEHAGTPAGQVAAALRLLLDEGMLEMSGADLEHAGPDTSLTVWLPWDRFGSFFDFEELPAPEHLY